MTMPWESDPVATAAPWAKDSATPWANDPITKQPDIPPASTWPGMMDVAKREAEPILQAFGHGFMRTIEPETLGLSKETLDEGAKIGLFESKDKYTGFSGPIHAFDEVLADTVSRTGKMLYRSIPALFAGAQEANDAAGRPIPRDFLSIQDAFLGSPHALSIPKPFVKPTPIEPIADAPFIRRSKAAMTGDPVIDDVLKQPTLRSVIDNAVVDRSRTIPYEAGGSTPLDDPTTYVDKHVPQKFTVRRLSDPTKTVEFDTGEPTAVHENIEEAVMDKLIKTGWKPKDAYRVSHFGWAM